MLSRCLSYQTARRSIRYLVDGHYSPALKQVIYAPEKDDGSGTEPPLLPEDGRESRRFKFPNPLASLKLLWAKDSALVTPIFGVFYMNLSSLQASTSTLFVQIRSIHEIELGLVYLPSIIGSCIGTYYAGMMFAPDSHACLRPGSYTELAPC